MGIFREDEGTGGIMMQVAWKIESCVGETLGLDAGYGDRKRGHPDAVGCFQLQVLCWPLPRLLSPRLSSGSVACR